MSNNSSESNLIKGTKRGIAFFLAEHGGHVSTKKVNTEDGAKLVILCGDGTEAWVSPKATEKILDKENPRMPRELVTQRWEDGEKSGYSAFFDGGEEIEISFD